MIPTALGSIETAGRTPRLLFSIVAACLACLGCQERVQDSEHSNSPSDAEVESVRWSVPDPDLETLEPSVREEIERQQSVVSGRLRFGEGTKELVSAVGKLALQFDARGFDSAAASCYREASRLQPDLHRWPYLLAHLDRKEGDLDAASRHFSRAIELRNDDLPSLLWAAQMELELGRMESAESLAKQALRLQPNLAASYYLLGQIASQGEQWDRAVEHYEKALSLEPQASVIRYPAAIAQSRLGNRDLAQEHLAKRGPRLPKLHDPLLLEVQSVARGADHHLFRGSQAMRSNNLPVALSEFRAAVTADPENPRGLLNLGAVLAQTGQRREAIEALEKALPLGLEPISLSKAHFNLCALHQMEGAVETAIHHCSEAVRWDAENATARGYLNRLLADPVRQKP